MPGLWATRDFDAVTPPIAVLIVDDDAAIADALAVALMAYGYRALVANRGEAALQVSQAWASHVVVLEIKMAPRDGFSVAEALRGST
ncbi:response regulator [Caballeronia zhejiangensis]|uniref:response regulator n=2 Tax=Caballeronia TaxID=1827195 RepID=UPI0035572CBA